jgi:hypothetical protein
MFADSLPPSERQVSAPVVSDAADVGRDVGSGVPVGMGEGESDGEGDGAGDDGEADGEGGNGNGDGVGDPQAAPVRTIARIAVETRRLMRQWTIRRAAYARRRVAGNERSPGPGRC